MERHLTAILTAMRCNMPLPYGIIQCYLPPDTSEQNTHHLNPSHTGWYSIYLPWRDGSRVQRPGYIPKKTHGFFLVYPPKKPTSTKMQRWVFLVYPTKKPTSTKMQLCFLCH